jgi:hypothetical protein
MSKMLHDKLQNQTTRTAMQKMESDMVMSLEKRFEKTKLNLDDIAEGAYSGLNELISMS